MCSDGLWTAAQAKYTPQCLMRAACEFFSSAQVRPARGRLQALVYVIFPSTTAVFSYAIGSRKLSANEQFFCWCSNSSRFVTNNSNKTRRVVYSRQQSLHQHKYNHNRLNRDGTLSFTQDGCDASHVYVRALALGCFYSHISTRSFQRALTASLDNCVEIKSAPFVA